MASLNLQRDGMAWVIKQRAEQSIYFKQGQVITSEACLSKMAK